MSNPRVLLLVVVLSVLGCSELVHKEPVSLGENMTECKIYRTGGASTYYLLNIHSDKIEVQYVKSNTVKKSETVDLTDEDYQRFASLFGEALSLKKLPYTFWKGGEEMLLENGDLKMTIALGDVKDGVYPKSVTELVDFIYKVSPMPLKLDGF